jgi:pimeloyl-ACP methyl ester carboxylesterase
MAQRRKNVSNTEAYTIVDRAMSTAVRSLSRVVGVRNITRPFWNRWRASLLGDDVIQRFLSEIDNLDNWLAAGLGIVVEEEAKFAGERASMTREQQITGLRRLSYLSHMAQWGSLPITEDKLRAYRKCRDYYVEAETLAFGDRYRRFSIPWDDGVLWGNLHVPELRDHEPPPPVVAVVHGMDDVKEEHLMSELALLEAGFAVLGVDGPGQGESLLLEGHTWPTNFHEAISIAVSAAPAELPCDPERLGLIGISWGGLWIYKVAADDARVGGLYDLGGPVDARRWTRLPYFLKTKYCQVLGISDPEQIPEKDEVFSIRDSELLDRVRCPVRIVHGGRDPLVPTADKQWLAEELPRLHPDQRVELKVYPNGDHCCTAYASEIRRDSGAFLAAAVSVPDGDLGSPIS